MKKTLLTIFTFITLSSQAQTIDKYFESIRNNNVELTAFFSLMPKGGDLHNHYSGSVYAETYISYVVDQDYAINENTLEVKTSAPQGATGWYKFSQLNAMGQLPAYKQKLMQKWSVKDYNGVSYPSDKQFFETFSGFGIANNSMERLEVGLMELKERAVKENVSYIETMFTGIPCDNIASVDTNFNHLLEQAQANHDEASTVKLLEKLYKQIEDKNVAACAATFNKDLAAMHKKLKMDDATFTMRYQNYVTRVVPPVSIFKALVASFMSANTSPLVVGVNIVAPEDNETSMRDYWLHMQMFRFCHNKFPNVKYAMHAGELTLGLVKPEQLTWHINEAVRTAGANRIGHGVDVAYERNSYDLLKHMAKTKTAIEINLYSNEFILKVKEDHHPFTLYKEFNVPIVICTDDAGVLRSNLTHQYVLLASRYKNVSYEDIKRYVFNSIDYSFIKEDAVKEKLKAQITERFKVFEKDVLTTHLNIAY
ncbi:MAG: adenosine deaminase [Flavipsychrobacter sp.]|nr:adenosine deaminase [Flavipsychrobacter sp.]